MSMAQTQLAVIEKFFDYSPDVAKKALAPMEASLKQSEELAKYMRFCQQIIHTSTNAAELKVLFLHTLRTPPHPVVHLLPPGLALCAAYLGAPACLPHQADPCPAGICL